MADAAKSTDYMPVREFQKRAREAIRRGDQPLPRKELLIDVAYDANFDVFAASTAFTIRHEIVYRSDGGVFARGFVRASGDLLQIHTALRKDTNIQPGATVKLVAYFWRRQDPTASMRWAMSIRFLISSIVFDDKNTIVFSDDEGEIITARQEVISAGERELAERILDYASTLTQGSLWNPPNRPKNDRVKRLSDWVRLAHSVGYPGFLDLWYYDRKAAWLYVKWETTPSQRKVMTAATQGRLPFDGLTIYEGERSYEQGRMWRHYPFRETMAGCRGQDVDICATLTANILRMAEDDIFTSIQDLNREVRRLTPVSNLEYDSWTTVPSEVTGNEAHAFIRHVVGLLQDKKTLYGTYSEYSQSWNWLDKLMGPY